MQIRVFKDAETAKKTVRFTSEIPLDELLNEIRDNSILEYLEENYDRGKIRKYFDFEEDPTLYSFISRFDKEEVFKNLCLKDEALIEIIADNYDVEEIKEMLEEKCPKATDKESPKSRILSEFVPNYRYDIEGLIAEIRELFK